MNCFKAFFILITLWMMSVSSALACPLHSSNGNNSAAEPQEQEAAEPAQV